MGGEEAGFRIERMSGSSQRAQFTTELTMSMIPTFTTKLTMSMIPVDADGLKADIPSRTLAATLTSLCQEKHEFHTPFFIVSPSLVVHTCRTCHIRSHLTQLPILNPKSRSTAAASALESTPTVQMDTSPHAVRLYR